MRSCTVTEHIQLPARPPARPPSLPALPAGPGRTLASPPCRAVPGPASPRGAPEHPRQQPSPGTLQPGHPPILASFRSHACRGTWGYRCPQTGRWRQAGSLPFLLPRDQGEQSQAQWELWHLAPSRVLPLRHPCQGRAAMGPLLGCAAPPRTAPAPPHCCHSPGWGAMLGGRGPRPGAPHIPLPLAGLFTQDRG